MKYIHKLSIRIVVAIVVGFLLAYTGTKITYSCTPVVSAAGCISFDKAVMHPNDLLQNKQDSLMRFSEAFEITSLVSFAILSIVNVVQKKSKPVAQSRG